MIIIPWSTDHGVYDNTLTTEWVLERGRQAMGDMGQNYTIGNVYDWIGFVRKCVEKEIYLRTNNRFTFIASEWRFPRLGSSKHGHQVSDT